MASGVKKHFRPILEILQFQTARPLAARRPGPQQHISLFSQAGNCRVVLRQSLSIPDEGCSQFADHLQRFKIVAADFAGHVAIAAGLALENDVFDPFVVPDRVVDQSEGNCIPSTGGIALKIIVADAGTAL
jgi:hypothetical protein